MKKTIKNYPENWKEISERIKNRDDWKCQNKDCGLQFSPNNKKVLGYNGKYQVITVHHKDRDVNNCEDSNLITLCSRCHCKEEWPLIRGEISEKKDIVKGQERFA